MRPASLLALLAATVAAALTSTPAFGATIVVGGSCTVADAIRAANDGVPVGGCSAGAFGEDTIELEAGVTYATGALPPITDYLRVNGNGATLDGGGAGPVLEVASFTTRVLDAAIRNGSALRGGGIRVADGAWFFADALTVTGSSATQGGGIAGLGLLSLVNLRNSTISGNSATGLGGGVFTNGALSIASSTISGNTSGGHGGGIATAGASFVTFGQIESSTFSDNVAGGNGGGLWLGHTAIVANSTISGNRVTQTGFPDQSGGAGIFAVHTVTLQASTVTENRASEGPSGIFGSPVTTGAFIGLSRSIVSGNAGIDCGAGLGTVASFDFNLVGVGCPANGTGDIVAAPLLAPLTLNAPGTTATHALLEGSLAIDAAGQCFGTDQRGVVRPVGAACDIGAYEGFVEDTDRDGDGVVDRLDNCADTPNPGQENNDGDAQGDVCDPDDDNDGRLDDADNCRLIANPDQLDTDGDGLGNACDPDDDNDGVFDGPDNCDLVANPGQEDIDGDGIGNACDAVDNRPICNGQPATIFGQAGVINGTGEADWIVGSPGADVINGGGGNDTICGAAGDDTIDGGAGDDRMFGEEGADTIVAGTGDDRHDGGPGVDLVTFADFPGRAVAPGGFTGVIVRLDTTTSQNTGFGSDRFLDLENIVGSNFRDFLAGSAAANVINGVLGDDAIHGDSGDDTLVGGRGDDGLDGSYGDDLLVGGLGDDEFVGFFGVDTVSYAGVVPIRVTLGIVSPQDTGMGTDAFSGVENVIGSSGNDFIRGRWAIEGGEVRGSRLEGGGGNDILEGDWGPDVLLGGSGNDSLFGSRGHAHIDGDDLCDGGTGFDVFFGGTPEAASCEIWFNIP